MTVDLPWRVGRKVGRTIYAVHGDEPSDHDVLIGMMDTVEFARRVVADHNAMRPGAEVVSPRG